MKKLSRREMLKLAGMTAAGALLASCAPAATSTSEAPAGEAPAAATPTTPPAAEAPAAEPTAVVNAYGKCDRPVKMMHGLTGSDGAVFATLLTSFADANPDVCISSEAFAWDTFFQKYPTAVAAGTPPDMVIFHQSEVAQMAAEGLMMPLDDMYLTGGIDKANYNPNLMKALTADGKIMAVPFDNHGWLLWYHTGVIKDAGLDPTNLPKNGAEFLDWAQKITTDKNGKHPNESGFDQNNVEVWAHEFTWTRYTIPTTLWQFGAQVINDEGTKATLDTAEAVAAIQYWKDMMYKHFVCPPAIPGKAWAGDLIKANKLAFMWEGTWTQGFMLDNPDLAKVVDTAFINSLAPDGKQAVKFDAHIMSIPPGVDPKGQDMAKTVITWLASNGAAWSNSGQVPANMKTQEEPEVQAHPSVAMAAKEFKEIGRTDMSTKYFIEIQTAYETAVGSALATAEADVAAELKKGNGVIQAILDRA